MADQTPTRDQFKYWKTVEVRWGDMDSQGHVNNSVYFTYLESARVELIRETGFKGKQAGDAEGPALVSTSCDFKRQVVYPATLDAGNDSLKLQAVVLPGDLVVSGGANNDVVELSNATFQGQAKIDLGTENDTGRLDAASRIGGKLGFIAGDGNDAVFVQNGFATRGVSVPRASESRHPPARRRRAPGSPAHAERTPRRRRTNDP